LFNEPPGVEKELAPARRASALAIRRNENIYTNRCNRFWLCAVVVVVVVVTDSDPKVALPLVVVVVDDAWLMLDVDFPES
jgi:hypothetical protein